MNRVFRTRTFTRWMRKTGLTDEALSDAVDEMARGLVDADLGGHVVKKRVALPGKGKSGGARTNIDKDELKALQEVAQELLGFNDQQLEAALAAGELVEVFNDPA